MVDLCQLFEERGLGPPWYMRRFLRSVRDSPPNASGGVPEGLLPRLYHLSGARIEAATPPVDRDVIRLARWVLAALNRLQPTVVTVLERWNGHIMN